MHRLHYKDPDLVLCVCWLPVCVGCGEGWYDASCSSLQKPKLSLLNNFTIKKKTTLLKMYSLYVMQVMFSISRTYSCQTLRNCQHLGTSCWQTASLTSVWGNLCVQNCPHTVLRSPSRFHISYHSTQIGPLLQSCWELGSY